MNLGLTGKVAMVQATFCCILMVLIRDYEID